MGEFGNDQRCGRKYIQAYRMLTTSRFSCRVYKKNGTLLLEHARTRKKTPIHTAKMAISMHFLVVIAIAALITPTLSCNLAPRSPQSSSTRPSQDAFPPSRNHTLTATENVAHYFHTASAAAGTTHFALYNMLCPRIENPNAGKIAAPPYVRNDSISKAAPKKVFDNVFFLGEYTAWESSPSAWGVDTGEGIVLIDALNADSVGLIESGLSRLGRRPEEIKYIIVGHAHSDHYGGARYLQDKYGARLLMSEIEYEFLEASQGSAESKPRRDLVVEDGQVFKLGETEFRFYITPGHTPGTVSTIFNTREGGKEHVVAQWGGTGFGFNGATGQDQIDWFLTYAESARRFKGLIEEHGADVLIANHPILDNSVEKLEALGSRAGNPWVVGVEAVANYTVVAGACALAGAAAFRG